MPWFDLDEEYYKDSLPANLRDIRDKLAKSNEDFSGIRVCQDAQAARLALHWANRKVPRNEAIVLRSPRLVEVKGRELFCDVHQIDWLGFDFVELGHWSLLAGGIFAAPSYFRRWHDYLNANGLMPAEVEIREYASDYKAAATKGGVEPTPDQVYGLEAIEVGRIRI